jgi:predicted enzyme related to lactoylglutathione lyase
MQVLVNIDVPDLERAIRFYSDALGLTLARRLGATGAELVGASSNIYLLEKPLGSLPFPGAPSPRSYLRHWTPVHVDFVCGDIQAAVARAQAAGASLENPIAAYAWGSIAVLADPFGNGFCLVEFTAPGYDAIAT